MTLDPIPEVEKPLRPQAAKRRVIEASVTIAKRSGAGARRAPSLTSVSDVSPLEIKICGAVESFFADFMPMVGTATEA